MLTTIENWGMGMSSKKPSRQDGQFYSSCSTFLPEISSKSENWIFLGVHNEFNLEPFNLVSLTYSPCGCPLVWLNVQAPHMPNWVLSSTWAEIRFLLHIACSRLSASADDWRLAGSGREKGEVKRACKHCFKNLIPVYQLLVYPLIGYFWQFISTPCLFVWGEVTLNKASLIHAYEFEEWNFTQSLRKE